MNTSSTVLQGLFEFLKGLGEACLGLRRGCRALLVSSELTTEQVAVALTSHAWMDGLELFLAWASAQGGVGGGELRRLRARDQRLLELLRVQLKLNEALEERKEQQLVEKLHLKSLLDEEKGEKLRNEVPDSLWVRLDGVFGFSRERLRMGNAEVVRDMARQLLKSQPEAVAIVAESLHKGPHGLQDHS